VSALAQLVPDLSALAVYGPLGIMCAFLMWSQVVHHRRTDEALTRLAKAQLLTMTGLGQLDGTVKKQAQQQLDEIHGDKL
jgi:hypothetical protein